MICIRKTLGVWTLLYVAVAGTFVTFLSVKLWDGWSSAQEASIIDLKVIEEKPRTLPRSSFRCKTVDLKTLKNTIKQFSRSQSQEDSFIFDSWFKGICGGTYVELGALDGVRYSNSHLYLHGFDWHGVLIEPNPDSFEALQSNRPKDELFNHAVCSRETEVHFVRGASLAVTGVYEFMAPSFRAAWHPNLKVSKLAKIKCKPLSAILEESSLSKRHVDFLSVDVEGGEYEVLKTVDFEKHQFGVIFYEADGHDPLKNEAIKCYLERNGYPFRVHTLRSNFHTNARWDEIYADLLV